MAIIAFTRSLKFPCSEEHTQKSKRDPIMSQRIADWIPGEEFTTLHRVVEDRRLYDEIIHTNINLVLLLFLVPGKKGREMGKRPRQESGEKYCRDGSHSKRKSRFFRP